MAIDRTRPKSATPWHGNPRLTTASEQRAHDHEAGAHFAYKAVGGTTGMDMLGMETMSIPSSASLSVGTWVNMVWIAPMLERERYRFTSAERIPSGPRGVMGATCKIRNINSKPILVTHWAGGASIPKW